LLLGQIVHVLLQRSGYGCVDLGLIYFVRDAGQEQEEGMIEAGAKHVPQLLGSAILFIHIMKSWRGYLKILECRT
jgi:hypothetical protein